MTMIEPTYNEHFGEIDIEVPPFTQHNWQNAESRDQWKELFREMRSAKDVAEWRSVIDDETDRKAAIIHVDHQNRDEWLEKVGEHDLHYRAIRYSEHYSGFSHRVRPADPNDPRRMTYAVISKNPDIADKMEEAENEMDGRERHDMVGNLLGFPDCCRDFFNKDWVDRGIRDPMYEISCNSDSAEVVDGDRNHIRIPDANPGACVLWRYFGLSFITHMPCSWDCENSIELARERYRIMAENGYEEAADAMYQWLELPFSWTCINGIAHIQNQHVTAPTNSSVYLDKKRIDWKTGYPQHRE